MSEKTLPQTTVDLSHAGVDAILAALTGAGLEVHYNETDGDHYIDIWLTDFDAEPTTILSWRDSQGWWIGQWDKGTDDTDPDRKWTVFGATPADVARDVSTILGAPVEQPAGEPTRRPSLLADPEQVALVRNLIRHARHVHAEHFNYAYGSAYNNGGAIGPQEHVWTLGAGRVSYQDGALAYQRHGKTILSGAGFDNARDVADLLAAIGVLPQSFASAYKAGQDATRKNIADLVAERTNPDRRCRRCGVRTGLKMVFSGLGYGNREWECRDGCTEVAR